MFLSKIGCLKPTVIRNSLLEVAAVSGYHYKLISREHIYKVYRFFHIKSDEAKFYTKIIEVGEVYTL